MINTTYYISSIPRLDPARRNEWIDWLLSEKYQHRQGQGRLQPQPESFCCLGVYCEETNVPKLKDTVDWTGSHSDSGVLYGTNIGPSRSHIPEGFGIPYAQGIAHNGWPTFNGSEGVFSTLTREGHMANYPLTQLNDDGFTFAQIADVIRYFL